MEKYYKILNVNSGTLFEEIEQKYRQERELLRQKSMLAGEEGNIAAKKITLLDEAFDKISNEQQALKMQEEHGTAYGQVREAILAANYALAQELLDDMAERGAEWHYWQSVLFYKRQWYLECKKQLKMALEMQPANPKYRLAFNKLNAEMMSQENFLREMQAHEDANSARGCFLGDCCAACCASCYTCC